MVLARCMCEIWNKGNCECEERMEGVGGNCCNKIRDFLTRKEQVYNLKKKSRLMTVIWVATGHEEIITTGRKNPCVS